MDSITRELRLKNIDLIQRVEKIEMTLSDIMADKEWDKVRVFNPSTVKVAKKGLHELREFIELEIVSIPKESKEYECLTKYLGHIKEMLAY